jgi:DNA-binding response OmpR family regulator
MAPSVAKAPVILVIDDDEKMREIIANILDTFGFKVIPAATSDEGLRLAAMQVPDMILCDVILPDALGFDTPVILITAYDTVETRAEARQVGASAYFRKPVDDQALLDAIEWALSHRHPDNGIE